MIKEFSFYHGVVFSALSHYSRKPLTIMQYHSQDNASYIINDNVGVYIKYSTKRLSPWQFSFQPLHLLELQEIDQKYQELVVMLVCRDDGIAGLTFEELIQVIDIDSTTTESISVNRRPREKYAVKGSLGALKYKISKTDFCDNIWS